MNVKGMIEEMGGKFFSVEFIKRTNRERRKMVCRLSKTVKIGKSGAGLRFDPTKHDLVTVLDVDIYKANLMDGRDREDAAKSSFRHIPLENVLKINGASV